MPLLGRQAAGSEPPQAQEMVPAGQTERQGLPRSGADTTIILDGITIEGSVRGAGQLRVEGRIEGRVSVAGVLTVARSGVISGPAEADDVQISGRVNGEIHARTRLLLNSSGSVTGDVRTASISIEPGGAFNGNCTMHYVETRAGAPSAAADAPGARIEDAAGPPPGDPADGTLRLPEEPDD